MAIALFAFVARPGVLVADDSVRTAVDDSTAPTQQSATGRHSDDDEPADVINVATARAHEQLFIKERFPSAQSCRTCHPLHYKEWSVSQHAYALVSPVFNALQGTIIKRTNGTFGDFCIRCHTQVGMILGEPVFAPAESRPLSSREGITCIVCHRINKDYGKVSGRLKIVEGDILDPVYGPLGNEVLQEVLADSQKYRVVTTDDATGRKIHTDSIRFFRMSQPGFCGQCHDVTFVNGFRLEELFTQYKRSPAAKKGVTCQDCHMGVEMGVNKGYPEAPAAVVGGIATRTRKHTVHLWSGPDHSVVHPGIFPHNPDAEELATYTQWTQFDYKAGWGTDEFEDQEPDDSQFPEHWQSVDDRYAAREIIDQNLELLRWAAENRLTLFRNGYKLGQIVTEKADDSGLRFKVEVKNGTDGHPAPSGFDAERLVWLVITITDRNGQVVFKSGDFDPNFDLRDLHSEFVHNGDLPQDKQLFTLRSQFMTRNLRGGDREQIIPTNYSVDPLPFVRPATRATSLTGRPNGARKHRRGLGPLEARWATYMVSGKDLTGQGPYTASIALFAGMAPAHLVRDIQEVGFDFNMSPLQIVAGVGAGYVSLWERSIEFDVHTGEQNLTVQTD